MALDYLERPALVSEVNMKTGEEKRVLEGRRAIVTGGGKGIGKGISIRLAEAGASVVIVGNSNMAMAEETCALIESRGGKAWCIGADLALPESIDKVVAFALEKMGGIDILVNNAAYQPNRDITEYSGDLFRNVIDINLGSYLRMTMACFPYLKESGHGRVINISSVHGKKPTGFDIAYATSKGGVTMLTRETAVAFIRYGITCNAILPGGTAIEFKTESSIKGMQDFGAHYLRVERDRRYRFGYRTGYPSDSGNMAVFLCSDLGEHYNGVQMRADGGMTLF